jgi:hypothetical protein
VIPALLAGGYIGGKPPYSGIAEYASATVTLDESTNNLLAFQHDFIALDLRMEAPSFRYSDLIEPEYRRQR